MALVSLEVVLSTIQGTFQLIDGSRKKDERISEALVSMQAAIIATRHFIEENGYQSSPNLSNLWLQAFGKVKNARIYSDNFPEYLYDKARFWGAPKDWLKEPGSLELIPKLNDLEKECERLMVMLRK